MDQSKELSRSTDVQNAKKLWDSMTQSDKVLMGAVINTVIALFQNIQAVQQKGG